MATLTGTSGADTLLGGADNDVITGLGGDDSLAGAAGDDSFRYSGSSGGFSTSGYDNVDGGDGSDELRATANNTIIGLKSFTGIESITSGGHTGVAVLGSTDGNYFDFSGVTLTGINYVDAYQGNDTVIGSAGSDNIDGGPGNDDLSGGLGDDLFNFYTANTGFDSISGGDGTDTIRAVSANAVIGLRYVTGVESITNNGFSGVTLTGSSGDDFLDFSGATITGLGGLIRLGTGNDSILGTSGNEAIAGDAGNDVVDGRGGVDLASYAAATAAVAVNLSLSGIQNTFGAGRDTLLNIENLVGSAYNDTLVGSVSDNSFQYSGSSGGFSTSGYDIVDGGAGTDEIRATANNTIIGLKSLTGIESITSGGHSGVAILGSSDGDLLNFSNVTLSGINYVDAHQGDDTVIGSAGADNVDGGPGSDTLTGGDGNDVFNFYTANTGFDSVVGGAGSDTVRAVAANSVIGLHYLNSVEAVTDNGYAGVTVAGSDAGDYLNFAGATVTGGARYIDVNDGADTVIGSSGSESIIGDGGDDVIEGGLGDDVLTGGSGNDTASYAGAGAAVAVSLAIATAQATGGGGSDQLQGFENLAGSAQGDTLTGDAAANIITGQGGDDVLDGGDGDDSFRYAGSNNGFDIVTGGDGADEIRAVAANTVIGLASISGVTTITAGGFSGVVIRGSASGDALDFSAVTLTGVSRIEGGDGADTLAGSTADDVIEGGLGDDVLIGGSGNNTFRFTSTDDSLISAHDLVADFVAGADKIDLSLADGDSTVAGRQTFSFIGTSVFSGSPGELRLDTSTPGSTRVQADLDGDSVADFEIVLTGSPSLTASDFLL